MKAQSLSAPRFAPCWRVFALACLAGSVSHAQQGSYPPPPGYGAPAHPQQYQQAPAYPQPQGYPGAGYQPGGYSPPPPAHTEYVTPMEFLPTFGRKFGNMFRRVFYGDAPPAEYQSYSQPSHQGGRSLDSAPPSYQGHYGEAPPQGYPQRYQEPGYSTAPQYPQQQPQYQQPQYQQPPAQPQYQRPPAPQGNVPQYQTPPAPRQSQAAPPGSRTGGSSSAPRMSWKQSNNGSASQLPPPQSSKKSSSTPPKKYTPPTLTKKNPPAMEEMPPPAPSKKETASAPEKEYYPLPGSQPKTQSSPSKTSGSASKPKSETKSASTGGNNGSFLKGKKAAKEGRVISPYPPYQELDVTGLSSGSLALDPTTQKVFEVP